MTGDDSDLDAADRLGVSIHARRVTGDSQTYHGVATDIVSIHARRVTGDANATSRATSGDSFNSRPSCDGRLMQEGGEK